MTIAEERRLLRLLGREQSVERIRNWLLHPDVMGMTIRRLWPNAPTWIQPRPVRPIGRGQRAIISRPAPTAGPIDAAQANLFELIEILERDQIDFFLVPDRTAQRYQVGVREADRSRLMSAMESHMVAGGTICAAPSTDLIRFQQTPGQKGIGRYRRAQLMIAPTWFYLRYQAVPGTGSRLLGVRYATVISFWRDKHTASPPDGRGDPPWIAATPNAVITELALEDREPAQVTVCDRNLPSLVPFAAPSLDSHDFPIDLVCMWVDGSDPAWMERRNERQQRLEGTTTDPDSALSAHLFRSRDELRYALRSVEMYAPFVRKVYLVTDDQRPQWLDETCERIELVSHREILDPSHLPTFNSNAIDTGLHRIRGLSEHFLMTNDDIMFCAPVGPEDFFTPSGSPHVFLSQAQIPLGPPVKGEPAVDSVEKNVRTAIRRRTGRQISQKHKHIPNAQRLGLRRELESDFHEELTTTAQHPFRDIQDVNPSHLANYYALATGRAVTTTLPYRYINMADPKLEGALREALAAMGATKVICFNDADSFVMTDAYGDELGTYRPDLAERDRLVVEFCRDAWPNPSCFER